MGLFSFFKNNRPGSFHAREQPDIPKEIFVEERDPQGHTPAFHTNGEAKGIEMIFGFLQADYESRGYNDALTNPDDSYKADNMKLIKMDLEILVQKVTTYYEDMIRDLDFHISSRGRAGLIDLVEELKSRKEMVKEHIGKVSRVKEDMETNDGITQRILLSYQRGFMRGLSALTQAKVLNQKF